MYRYVNKFLLNNLVFYKITNLDSRIKNPDSRMTHDIDQWASNLSSLFSYLTKPILDIILFSYKLSNIFVILLGSVRSFIINFMVHFYWFNY